jgi:DNA repair exonuclease SbcCD nuclease subunit
VRILLFADLHAHKWTKYLELSDITSVLDQIRSIVEQDEVDLVLFAGDLFHTRGKINVEVFNEVYRGISSLSTVCQIGLLVGNHDQENKEGNIHSLYGLSTICTVMDEPRWYIFEDHIGTGEVERLHVLAIPYTTNKEEVEKFIDSDVPSHYPGVEKEASLLLGHLSVDGAKVGSNFVLEDKAAISVESLQNSNVDQVFLGHYHTPQCLGGRKVFYLGAPMQHNWGDRESVECEGERGCWVWDTKEEDPTFWPLLYPKFEQVRYQDLGAPTTEISGNFIRVTHSVGTPQEDLDTTKEHLLQSGARTVEFVAQEENVASPGQQDELGQHLDIESLIVDYVNSLAPEELDKGKLIEMAKEILLKVEEE